MTHSHSYLTIGEACKLKVRRKFLPNYSTLENALEAYHLPRLGLHSMACQAEISVVKNCDAATMTDGTSSLSVTSSSQTESLMTSFYYEFECMSTREQVSLVQRLFDQICCKVAIPSPNGFIHSAVTSMVHLHKRKKNNVIAGLANALGEFYMHATIIKVI